MTVVNVSFAAAGFLGIYHLGVIEAVLRHGDKLLCSLKACAGASAGALAATVMITAPDKLQHCKDFTYRFARNVRSQSFGAVTPGYDFMLELRGGIEEILPPDAHQLANERLHISVTNSKTRKNCMVSSFSSKEDLVQFSKDNIIRLNQVLFPPSLPRLKELEQEGYEDAVRFLEQERWMQ
ncbi:patatin-like phospholipase domain-containing protein 4 [Triplophysa rosa]|uniref:Patatin-like phospholipase domain-containing protein 4 n=1 Tax=Triplophysa rosa TaxID=992332 RepID=A0A9W8C841_TRIRA|nr:patatin-like phospholipase domain-containing protein 4 [Triplophysa rosa]